MLGIGGKSVAMGLQAEQIEPLANDHEEIGVAREGHPARHVDWVIAAELGGIDFRMSQERGAISLIMEAPDRTRLLGLVVRQAEHGLILDEIGHGIESIDGETGETRSDNPFGSRGADGRGKANIEANADRRGQNDEADQGDLAAKTVSFLPLYRHSSCR